MNTRINLAGLLRSSRIAIFISQWLSWFVAPIRYRYLIVGYDDIPPQERDRFQMKLRHFFEAESNFVFKTKGCWNHGHFEEAQFVISRTTITAAIVAGIAGRVLHFRTGNLAQKVSKLLWYKCYPINHWDGYRLSSWNYLRAGARQRPGRAIAHSEKFVPSGDTAVLLGTGPSAELVFEKRFEKYDLIACNTSIKSDRLLKRGIKALCVCDATFFMGNSRYSAAFLSKLTEAMTQSSLRVVHDADHYSFLSQQVGSVSSRSLYPVWLNDSFHISTDFSRHGPCTTPLTNVMTTLMLPFAASHYKRLLLVGFDGKAPNVNYFWKHSDEFQYSELLPTVRQEDAGFFSGIDFQALAEEHDSYLGKVLQVAEQNGCSIELMHPTYIQPLKKYFSGSQ